MKCPSCAAELVHDTRDMPHAYKGKSTLIPALTGDYCPACDESILNLVESRRTMNCMVYYNKQVNASIIAPGFIASVRKNSRLISEKRQSCLAEESMPSHATKMARPSRPSLALVKLLKILERHPDLLNEVRSV